MDKYRSSSHTRFDIKYHFVWITKYRKKVLSTEVGIRLRDWVCEICRTHDIEILEGLVSLYHVRVLLSCPPSMSASDVMHAIKGKTARKLLEEFPHTCRQYWGCHLWARGILWPQVEDEVIAEYIRLQDGVEPSDGGGAFSLDILVILNLRNCR
ncbi:MAG: IS200/IS605 family transposase [Planctomycetia bacterium]|nr:IS200/IS605 family transposase [Planctomycetia bacterium]